ncbi:MAG: hypothetical protein M0Z94_19805 [Dehalococcoidales bacterium]|nr:hypothetical protein [Dehalococcoidales bacterium]
MERKSAGSPRKVVIVFHSPMFSDIIQSLLKDSAGIQVIGAGQTWPDLAGAGSDGSPDVLIVERGWNNLPDEGCGARLLGAMSNEMAIDKIILLSLNDTAITSYIRRQLDNATGERLIAEVVS